MIHIVDVAAAKKEISDEKRDIKNRFGSETKIETIVLGFNKQLVEQEQLDEQANLDDEENPMQSSASQQSSQDELMKETPAVTAALKDKDLLEQYREYLGFVRKINKKFGAQIINLPNQTILVTNGREISTDLSEKEIVGATLKAGIGEMASLGKEGKKGPGTSPSNPQSATKAPGKSNSRAVS